MSGLAEFVIDGVDVARQALAGMVAQAAEAPAASAAGAGGMGGLSTIAFLVLMLGVLFFLMWRPQSKQYKEHQAMLAALKKGDEVILLNGILGKIHEVGDRFIVLEVARDVRLRVIPSAISAKVPAGALENGGAAGDTQDKSKDEPNKSK